MRTTSYGDENTSEQAQDAAEEFKLNQFSDNKAGTFDSIRKPKPFNNRYTSDDEEIEEEQMNQEELQSQIQDMEIQYQGKVDFRPSLETYPI